MKFVLFFNQIRMKDVPLVGGKTASLGELMRIGMPVPNGFGITADAYRYFLRENGLDKEIRKIVKGANLKNVKELQKVGRKIRNLIMRAPFPQDMEEEILKAFDKLGAKRVAVRSSATAEDLPTASFAGQQESFLNVTRRDLLEKVKRCFASLFTDRAISYREDKGFDHFKIALSVAVQKQIFSKASGVMFTIDPDSGNGNFIVINASYGLGDFVVQGIVTPDEFLIFKQSGKIISKALGRKDKMEVWGLHGVKTVRVSKKKQKEFSISDEEAEQLAQYARKIEKYYGRPMDIEWAKDNNGIWILQARPETVHSSKKREHVIKQYVLKEKGKVLGIGIAVGRKIVSGVVNIIKDVGHINKFKEGQILVTKRTDPDWEPIMKIAKGIITEEGGRTSHAAIVSRELGVACIVGMKNATRLLKTGEVVTMDCTKDIGKVYKGSLKFEVKQRRVKPKKTRTKIFINIGEPGKAPSLGLLPVDGVGLAREEFIISSFIGIHPLELIRLGKEDEFVEKLAAGIGKIATSFYPRPVVVRLSDFKTNEYRRLKGGEKYEPQEENPMIGWRGASRYISPEYRDAFMLELEAFKKLWKIGLKNIIIMVPFCRTVKEAREVTKLIRTADLKNRLWVMAEIPSNIFLADQFCKYFDGFSIGSNDLTQLILGIDRDSKILAREFDEKDEAVKRAISHLIKVAHEHGRTVSICGEASSYFPEFTKFLVEQGIDSISVSPDKALETQELVARIERKI